jgi:hypothetical protein
MPWSAADASSHTKKADTPAKKKRWAAVANAALGSGSSEGSAVRQANAVIAGAVHRHKSLATRSR